MKEEKPKMSRDAMLKLRSKLVLAGILVFLFVSYMLFGRGNPTDGLGDKGSADGQDRFAEVRCNFINYESIIEEENAIFVNRENDQVIASIYMNNHGQTTNLTAYLEPRKYYVINTKGGVEKKIEFDVESPDEYYRLDIECVEGDMELIKTDAEGTPIE